MEDNKMKKIINHLIEKIEKEVRIPKDVEECKKNLEQEFKKVFIEFLLKKNKEGES